MMKFDLPKDQSSIIKVIGVGGGGSNAVNHMFRQGIKGVDFLVCNTDHQALDMSPVPIKIQLGKSLTDGRGAGALPDVGMNAAIENIDEIREILETNTQNGISLPQEWVEVQELELLRLSLKLPKNWEF